MFLIYYIKLYCFYDEGIEVKCFRKLNLINKFEGFIEFYLKEFVVNFFRFEIWFK